MLYELTIPENLDWIEPVIKNQNQAGGLTQYIPLIAIITSAFVLRIFNLPGRWLWYDELQSVTLAGLSIQELINNVYMFDPHPPLYYLQLHFWMIIDTSDWWIKLNSVFWSMITVISIYFICKEIFNRKLALYSSLIFALSPFAIFYSQEARMYSMLMFLGIWSFYFTYRFLIQPSLWKALGIIVFTCAFLYSHGAGFMLLVSLFSFVGLWLLENKFKKWKTLLLFLFIQALVFIIYIPWLQRASALSVGHTLKPALNDIASTIFILLFGFFPEALLWLKWILVIFVTVGITAASIRSHSIRTMAISFFSGPDHFLHCRKLFLSSHLALSYSGIYCALPGYNDSLHNL